MQLAEPLQQMRLRWQPWSVLAPLVVVLWIGAVLYARGTQHAGWYVHHEPRWGWDWTGAWLLGHGHLSGVDASFGWSLLLAPLSWIVGPDLVSALPVLIVLQGLVLLPLGAVLVYATGRRLGGQAVAYLAGALWVAGPFLTAAQLRPGDHRGVEQHLVAVVLGLTASAALPGTVALLASAWLTLRALDSGGGAEAAGLAAGLAVAVEPLNGLFLFAPLLALTAARRWRGLAGFALGLAPCLVAIALWRARGPGGLDLGGISHALQISGSRLSYTFVWIREDFWSLRILQWIAAAGFVGLLRVAPAKGLLVGSWLLAFVLFRGSDPTVDSRTGTFWTAVLPGLPAFCLLTASLPLLLPTWGMRLARRLAPASPPVLPRRVLVAAAVVLAGVPLVLVAAGSHARSRAVHGADGSYVPAGRDLGLTATARGGTVTLAWSQPSGGPAVFTTLYRGETPIATTYSTTFADAPGPGRWTYRLARGATEVPAGGGGIGLLESRPVTVAVQFGRD